MSNELIFIITAVGTFGFIRYCFFKGRRWLHASNVVSLILISVFGAKLISIFGITTNVGNIFYAGVFFAVQLLVEHYGKEEGKRSIAVGFAAVVFFVAIGQLTVRYAGIPEAFEASKAIETLFKFTPRLAAASLAAYVFAQFLNVGLYGYLRTKYESKIWIRSIIATAAGQLLDSVIFFSVAFWGVIPLFTLLETMLAGFAVKFALGVLGIPFLYSSYTVKTQREVLEQEAEAIILGIGDGLVMTDHQGKIVMANRAFEEMLGWKMHDVVGKQMTDIVTRYDEAGTIVPYKERILTKVLSGEKVLVPMTNHTYFAKKDGTKFPVRIIVTPVVIDTNVMGAVEVFQDVTKEKEIETLRANFLSLASHQLRTPLSGTRWVIETLRGGILGPMNDRQKKYLDNLYRINAHMIQLVSDMLSVLRLEGTAVEMIEELFVLTDVCDDAVVDVASVAKEKGVAIKKSPAFKERWPIAETDRRMTKGIVAALISNAVNYSRPGSEVYLDVRETAPELLLSVKDDGIGIPEDEQERVFERFYRASNVNEINTDGTGLGLYIASIFAKKIGAKVTFESVRGKGSTFYLHLPKVIPESRG